MNTYLSALRSIGAAINPPASASALRALEDALGWELTSDLRALYDDHGGVRTCRLPMRFMSPTEAGDTLVAVRRNFPSLLDAGAGLFWTDDNSNYAGVFLAEPLRGRVFFLDHEEPIDAPRFRSVQSFCTSMLAAAGSDWAGMPSDYPRLANPADIERDEDRAVAVALLRILEEAPSPDGYARSAHCALNLLPPYDFAQVLPLLRSADMGVQERAAQVLGLWRCAAAVPALLQVGRTGMHNGQVAAVRALQRIGTSEASGAVNLLKSEMGPAFEWLFRTTPPASWGLC
jgi:hypothetical protein